MFGLAYLFKGISTLDYLTPKIESCGNVQLQSLIYIQYVFYNCTFLSIIICLHTVMMVRVFANGPGDLGLIPGRVIPKTQKKNKINK